MQWMFLYLSRRVVEQLRVSVQGLPRVDVAFDFARRRDRISTSTGASAGQWALVQRRWCGENNADHGSAADSASDPELPAQRSDALAHAQNPMGQFLLLRPRRQTDSVVSNIEPQPFLRLGQSDPGPPRMRVPQDIREGFLQDSEERNGDRT